MAVRLAGSPLLSLPHQKMLHPCFSFQVSDLQVILLKWYWLWVNFERGRMLNFICVSRPRHSGQEFSCCHINSRNQWGWKMCFWLQDWMALVWALYCIMKHLEGADYILHLQIKIFFTHLNSPILLLLLLLLLSGGWMNLHTWQVLLRLRGLNSLMCFQCLQVI